MQWYVLQTRTGEEEKLVEMIRRIVPRHLYGECFVIYHEQLWRRQQKNLVQVRRAFPGYVFITPREPRALFFCLKQLPAMVKMMARDDDFVLPVEAEEKAFLKKIMDVNHVIGLSYLKTDGKGNVLSVTGPMKSCISRMVLCRFGKRYALVRMPFLGKEKEIFFGIVLKEDLSGELWYGKVEAPIRVPERYRLSDKVRLCPEKI